MSKSLPGGGAEPSEAEAAPSARSRSDVIIEELKGIAYSLFHVLPEPMNEVITERALAIVEERPQHVKALCAEPDPVARRLYFVMGPARAAIYEYRHHMFAPDEVNVPARTDRPNDAALKTLLTTFEALSPAEKRALLLYRIWGLTQRDAATLLGVSQTAVSRAVKRAENRVSLLRPDRPEA